MLQPLFTEFKRRRVFRAMAAYGLAAFAVLQIIEPIMHGLHWPDAVLSYAVAALAAGFPVVVGLAWIFDVGAGGIERAPPSGSLGGAKLALALIGIGMLAASPGVVWYLVVRRAKPAAASAPAAPSIAVLPFADMSPQKDQEYFADGIAEEILNALAQIETLHVAGRTSSFSFKGRSEDLRGIGEKLGVSNVLEGSVRKEGNRVRITAQLVNAASGFHLWSQTYDRELTGVLAAQDEIARAVVEALKLRLLPVPRRHEPSHEAHQEYLIGNQAYYRLTYENYVRAAAAYRRAVQLDPDYAQAWAALAMAQAWVADGASSTAAVSQGFDQAMSYAEKSLALDPELPEGYAARGFLRSSTRHDWAGARADFTRALKLNPSDAEARRRYAQNVLAATGDLGAAVEQTRRATEIDPLSAHAWATLGRILCSTGRLEEARVAFDKSLLVLPDQNYAAPGLALLYLLEKKPAEALVASQRSSSELFRKQVKAMALHDLGRSEEARRELEDTIARMGHDGAFQIAETYAWVGENDKAFEWLNRAYDQRDGGLVFVKYIPTLRGLRGDPRFKALLEKMHLPTD